MKLNTHCGKCFFNGDNGCDLDKVVIFQDEKQFCPGFCRQKTVADSKESALLLKTRRIDGIHLIVDGFDNDLSKIANCINNTNYNFEKITVLCKGLTFTDEMRDLRDNCLSKKESLWEIKRINVDHKPNDYRIYHTGFSNRFGWSLMTEAQEESLHPIIDIYSDIKWEENFNFAMILDETTNSFLVDSSAFLEMGGNDEMVIWDKFNYFENKDELCLRLRQ